MSRAIRFGGEDLKDKKLDLTSGLDGELEILLSPMQPTSLESCAMRRRGCSWRTGPDIRQRHDRCQGGDYRSKRKLPSYRPCSWRVQSFRMGRHDDGIITDPDFRKTFETQAASLTLSEKSTRTWI